MKLIFKRIGAYIIDILIVSIISALLSNIGALNYQIDKYMKSYDEIIKVTEKFQNKEIKKADYDKQFKNLSYNLEKNSTITTIISLACLIGYFGIFQYSQNGKTLGKRIFKLQVIKNKEGNLNITNYLLRSLILNNIIFTIARLILIYTLSKNVYMSAYNYLSSFQVIVQLLIIISIFVSKEGRGIHDLIAGTKVIDLKAKDEFKSGIRKKVVEGEIIK